MEISYMTTQSCILLCLENKLIYYATKSYQIHTQTTSTFFTKIWKVCRYDYFANNLKPKFEL